MWELPVLWQVTKTERGALQCVTLFAVIRSWCIAHFKSPSLYYDDVCNHTNSSGHNECIKMWHRVITRSCITLLCTPCIALDIYFIDWLNNYFFIPAYFSCLVCIVNYKNWSKEIENELGRVETPGPAFNGDVNTQRVTQDQISHLEWFWRRSHGTETDVVTQKNLPTATNNKR